MPLEFYENQAKRKEMQLEKLRNMDEIVEEDDNDKETSQKSDKDNNSK